MSASLGRLWAIARMTLLEASRRKVFTILLLFSAVLLSSAAFFPSVSPEGRLRLMEVWSLRAATLFAAIVALFLSGFSLPLDFEQKRIYLLVTKPVSKVTVFVGKFLGFVLLLAVFLGIMGVIAVVFIRGVSLLGGPEFPALAAYPRLQAAAAGHEGGVADDRRQKKGFVVEFGRDSFLRWRFERLDPAGFPETVRGDLKLAFDASKDAFRASGHVRLVARGGKPHEQVLFLQQNEERAFSFPREAIGPGGALEIAVYPHDTDGAVTGWADSVAIYQKPVNFELNYLRGLALVLVQSTLVLAMTLMASTFLSAPVSILLGVMLYLVGTVHGFVLEGTRDIERELEAAGQHPEHRTPEDIPEEILKASTVISNVMLAAVPAFERFDFSLWLLKDRAVSWREIGVAGAYAFPRVLLLVLLGILAMAFKDFG